MSERKNLTDTEHSSSHGIFISYKRSDKHLAGRFFDYFHNRGIAPFMDEHSLRTSSDYRVDLDREISQTPYFLFLLTEKGAADLCAPDYKNSIYVQELLTAFKTERRILIAIYGNVNYKELLRQVPEELSGLHGITPYELPETARMFYPYMNDLFRDIDLDLLKNVLDWREYTSLNANTLILPRVDLEKQFATLENRFGEDLVAAVRAGEEFKGENRIKEINMACYAASLVFTPARTMIDRRAYDYGVLFNIFTELLRDRDFNLRIITMAPDSRAAQDACDFDRLGNSALEEYEEAVFLSSYANLCELRKQEPYLSADKAHRFSFMLTECALPYAIFQVVYKEPWKQFNHIKLDLYSFGIDSSVERPSMIFFEHDPASAANYSYFKNQLRYLRGKNARKRSEELIAEQHEQWIRNWETIREAYE